MFASVLIVIVVVVVVVVYVNVAGVFCFVLFSPLFLLLHHFAATVVGVVAAKAVLF